MNDTESGLPSRSRIADLERLLDVARHLGATVDLDALLETIAVAATSVLDCERATVYLYDQPAGELCSRLATGIADSPINEIRFPVSRGIAGEVARTGHSVNLPDGRFVTLFCGLLDPSRGTLHYVSAAQAPIYVYEAATGLVREYAAQGLPLGFVPEITYDESADIHLAEGDLLVLLTDGFFEWSRPDGEQFGEERVREIMRRHHALPAAGFIDLLHRAVVEFTAGTRQGDDLTAVVVKRIATPAAV